MTPQQALQILSEAAAKANMPLQDHVLCKQAAEVLAPLCEPTDEEPETEETETE